MSGQRPSPRVIIIGGGVIGLSTAYHLALRGCEQVLLLERNTLTSGTSWHAAGIVGPLRASRNLTRLAIYATELFGRLEAETGQATGYRRTGGLWLATRPERIVELERIADLGRIAGLGVRMLDAEGCRARLPLLATDDVLGGLWVDQDGQTDPVGTCMAYAKGARAAGARLREGVDVTAIHRSGAAVTGVTTRSGEHIACDVLVICAGAWSRELGKLAGVGIPVQAVEHMYVVTEPVAGLPSPCPIVRDLDAGIYVKEDAGRVVLGGFEHNAKLWSPDPQRPEAGHLQFPEDWVQFEPFLESALHRLPALHEVGIRHFMNGPESFTPDTRQVMGELPGCRGLYVAAGFNSIGIVSSAGAGRALADWIIAEAPPFDLWEVDIARFGAPEATRAFLAERTPESVANQFDLHWPLRQPRTGRGVRRTPLHHALSRHGAVFGAPAGWERPLWYAADAAEAALPLSYGAQAWWPIAEREARALSTRVGLLELSPFTKLRIAGAQAGALLDALCTARIDRPVGSVIYTLLLNARGGIECEATLTRVAEQEYWLVSGAPTRTKDLAWLQRAAERYTQVDVSDITSAWAVIGVMGPDSRALLGQLSEAALDQAAFPFATSRSIDVGPVVLRASRVSYVGELGWELYVPAESAERVHEALVTAGKAFGLAHVGHWCLEGCRLEKAYRHFGHDMGPDDSPLEAGLMHAVHLDKGEFLGRTALLAQREQGVRRRLLHFEVEGGEPLLLHDEPIYAAGRVVGVTTSGGRGFRLGRSFAFAYVDCAPHAPLAQLRARSYEIAVAGERLPVRALEAAPYDPRGERLRG